MPKPDPTAGTFEELIAEAALEPTAIAQRLRELIQSIHPETVEVVRLGDNAASYGVGPKKMSEAYCYIMPQKDRVNLGFYYGAALDDPEGLLEGTGKKLRHVKVRSAEEASSDAIRQLIETALQERRTTLGQ